MSRCNFDCQQGRQCDCEGTLDEPIPDYPLIGWLSVVIIAVCMLWVAAAVKGWL